jgi:hypothetical protein
MFRARPSSFFYRQSLSFVFATAMLIFWGCSTPTPTRVYSIPHGTLVLTDDLNVIREACRDIVTLGTVIGCYQPSTQTIFCSGADLATCGHELLHHVGLVHEAFEDDASASTKDLVNHATRAVPD